MPMTLHHDPELVAVLTAAAATALGRAVKVTDVQPAAGPIDDSVAPPTNSLPPMTPGIAARLPEAPADEADPAGDDTP